MLELLKDDGTIDFLTPSTIAQDKKDGFKLRGLQGLKLVDYTANDSFNVGVNIIRWKLTKGYNGDITVIDKDGTKEIRKNNETLVQSSQKVAFNLFEKLKNNEDKLFNMDRTADGKKNRQLEKDKLFKYPFYVNYFKKKIAYSKKVPKHYLKKKLGFSLSKTYSKDNIIQTTDDLGQLQIYIDVDNYSDKQIENVKLFLFNDISVKICTQYKKLFNTGVNAILYSFPKIDSDTVYTDEDVIKIFDLTDDELEYLNGEE